MIDDPARELTWLRKVQQLSQRLATEQTLSRLLPQIIDAAIELTEAERGYLVRIEGRRNVRIVAARGFDKTGLRKSSGDISQTVVERVLAEERGVVTTHQEDSDLLTVSSVQDRRVRCIIGVPLRLRGDVRGALYLDHRFRADAFSQGDLPLLQTFADQAALAIETAELRQDYANADARLRRTLDELAALQVEPPPELPEAGPRHFGRLVGASPAMLEVYQQIERAARAWDPVLILGESGTGKELVAQEIHTRSGSAPFRVERLAITASEPELLERLQSAREGTLLLRDIDELPTQIQRELLGLLQSEPRPSRILAASRHDLRALALDGKFREDLYYRLDVTRVTVPPLRERAEDVPLLIEHFLARFNAALVISPRAQRLLSAYAWPGNVRELENEVRRLASLGQREISAQQLSEEIREGRGVSRATVDTAGKTLAEVERRMVEAALKDCGGNKAQTARQLGVPRSTLYSLMKRYGLE